MWLRYCGVPKFFNCNKSLTTEREAECILHLSTVTKTNLFALRRGRETHLYASSQFRFTTTPHTRVP